MISLAAISFRRELRALLLAAGCFAAAPALAQVRPVTGIMAEYDYLGITNDDYSVRGGGSGDYPTSTVYNLRFNVGEQNNLIIRGFETGTNVYNYIQLAQRINIVRVDNPMVTGLHNIVFFEESSVAGSNVYLKPSLVSTMVESLRSDLVNRGADNVFANQGDGNGNNNNIERIDYIFNAGFPYYNFTDQRGFLVMDRGGNDRFKIAVITAVDSNGLPAAFSRPVSVLDTDWGPSGITLETTVMRGYTESGSPLRPSARTTVQSLSGVYLSWDQFGLTTNDMVHGYSLAANDVTTNGALWLQVTNPLCFPTNTTVESEFGGLDLISGGAMFFDEVLEVGIGDRVWEDWDGDGIQDAGEPGLSNVLVHIYTSSNVLAATARSDENGGYFAQGMGPGTYTVQFFPPDGYQFSPQYARTDPSLDSDPDALTGITDPSVLSSGQTNLNVDAGLFLTPGDLRLSKSVAPTNANIGQTLVFTLAITNVGTPNTALIQVTDILPAAFAYAGSGATAGAYNPATGIWDVGALAAGGAASLAITGTVAVGAGGSVVTNRATISQMNRPDTNLTDNAAAAVFTVEDADLAVAKMANKSALEENESVRFTVAVTNLGPNDAQDIRITDLLPAGLVLTNVQPSQGVYTNATGAWALGGLTHGASASLVIDAVASVGSGGLILTNTASVAASSHEDPNAANNSAAAVVIIYGADLALGKQVAPPAAVEGQTVTYTLTVHNPGPSEATGIQVSEPLTNGLVYAGYEASQGSYSSGTGIWLVGALGVNSSATLRIQATVGADTMDTVITNRARIVATDIPDPDAANDEATATLPISSLVLSKTSDVAVSVHPGDTITYTVVASNAGGQTHANLVLSDAVPDGTVYVPGSLSVISVPANSTTVVYSSSATFVVPAGVTSVIVEAWGGGGGGGRARGNPATGGGGAGGAFARKTVAVTPSQSYAVTVGAGGIGGNGTGTDTQHGRVGGPSWFGTTNTVFAEGGARGLSDGNINYANGLPGLGSSALSMGDSVYRGGNGSTGVYTSGTSYRSGAGGGGAGSTGVGGHATSGGTGGSGATLYGGNGANGVTNNQTGANGATYGGGGSGGKANSSTDRNGGSGANGLVRLTYEAKGGMDDPPDLASDWSLAPGQQLLATFQVQVDDPLAWMAITNTATATSAQQALPVSATVVDPVIHVDLAVSKQASASSVAEADSLVFTVIVSNLNSQATATGVEIADLLPAGFDFTGAVPSQGSYDSGSGIWSVGDLSPESGASLEMTVTAADAAGGFYWTNTAAVSSCDQVDTDPANNSASAVVLVTGADIGVTKAINNPTPNETSTVVYTIRLTNSGPSDISGVTVTDPLTNGMTYVTNLASQGSYDSPSGVWSVGSLLVGQTASLELTATIKTNTFGSTLTNQCWISAASLPDPVASNNEAVAAAVVSGLRVSKVSDLAADARPGDTIAYTIMVSNLSTVTHTGIQMMDSLPPGTVYVDGSLSVGQTPANPPLTNAYTNSTTFVPPPGVTSVTVEAWGGGGGGGMALGNPSTGGGGAGGSYARRQVEVVAGQAYTVTVGAEGAGGASATTNGTNGGASWFSTTNTIYAQGGARGMGTSINSNNAAAGAGSSAQCLGDVVYRGGHGSTGVYLSGTSYYSGAGGGGAGSTGNGGDAASGTGGDGTAQYGGAGANGVTNNRTGGTGSNSGGGGSGGKANTTTDQAGGAGAPGLVRISYVPKGATNIPPNLVSNWTLAAGATLTATFSVTVVNPGSTTQLVNSVSVTCDQQPTPVTAAVTNQVIHSDLGLTQTVDNVHPNEGDTVVYTLVVTNLGPLNVTNIVITDLLANGLIYVSHVAGAGSYNPATGAWSLADLSLGASAQLQLSATVAAGTAGTTLTNQAEISAAGAADILTENNVAVVEITVVSVDVGLGKSATPSAPAERGLLVYDITATNYGPDSATGITIRDILPNGVTYVSQAADTGSYDPGTGTWTLGTLAPSQTAHLALTTIVNTNTAGRAITNTASILALEQVDIAAANDSAQVVVTPGTSFLSIRKTAEPAGPVGGGDILTYHLAITNRSGLTQTNVTVADPLPAGTIYVADSCQVNAPVTVNETFGDQFSRRVYSNNDGTEIWASEWIESESNGPTAGYIQIQFDNGVDETYTLKFTGGSQTIRRAADLSSYTSARLEFDYQRIGLDSTNEYVAIQISTNGLTGWTELGRFRGSTNDADYLHFDDDISAYRSAATTIRFSSPAGMDGTDIVWIDDILLTGTRRTPQVVAGGAPPDLVSGIVLEQGEALDLEFQVWVDNPATVTQIVNQAALTSAQMPDPQVDTAVTPVTACFTLAPDGLQANPTNITSFGAGWNEVDGCFGYRLDVATDPAFAATSYVPGYSNRAVAGSFQTVTGLTHDVLYYFRVRAEWDVRCTSVNSATALVQTLGIPTIAVSPEELDFGVVDVRTESNLVLVVTNSGSATLNISSIEFSGGGNNHFTVLPATAELAASNSLELTVTYAPIVGGTNEVVMTIHNDSGDRPEVDVPVRGYCFDPAMQPPELLAFHVIDSYALTNEVTDRSLGNDLALVYLAAYHYNGITLEGTVFDILYPDGTVALSNAVFTAMAPVVLGGRNCQELTAAIPRFFPAVLGVYTVRATVASSNGMWVVRETNFAAVAAGTAVPVALDSFSRSDVADNIGESWISNLTGPVPGNIQIRDRVLQLYGTGGTGGTNGRISVVRDLSSRYNPVWTNNAGTMTWAFNFYSGRANQAGLAPGAYGAVFVLGADSADWVTGAGNGYAVRICSNQVTLASFAGGLNLDTDLVPIGTPAAMNSATTAVAVQVELVSTTGVWRLYVHPWTGSGIGAFGNPLSGIGDYLVMTATNTLHLHRSLPFVGCYWNHGNAAVGAGTAAFYDDLYAPYVLHDSEPMCFSTIDNDIMLPTPLGNVQVNEESVPDEVPDRFEVVWTNAPEFVVTFESLASDQDPGYSIPTIQRDVRGIGEYRVSPDPVNVLSASNRGVRGLPFPVVTTNGALANYGFEMITAGGDWHTNAACAYQYKSADPALVFEGTNSLRQTAGGVAYQTFEFRNADHTPPQVAFSGWHRGGPAQVEIAAYDSYDQEQPSDTLTVPAEAASAWSSFALAQHAIGSGTTEFLRVSLVTTSSVSYWDNLNFSVDIGTNRASMRFHAGAENQGLVPQYIYAVDADYNRNGDRLGGLTKFFYIPFDITPPAPVEMPAGGAGVNITTVDDPTSQFDLQWSTNGLGPDDPASPLHPTKRAEDIDILSPWKSYRIYYGTYDSQAVPPGDDPNSTNGYIYRAFIENEAFRSWPYVDPDTAIADPTAPGYQPDYQALTNMDTTHIRLYDLEYDREYVVIVVAKDKAGNVGNAGVQSWATNDTIRFALIRGETIDKAVARQAFPTAPLDNTNAPTAAALHWIASGPTNEQGEYLAVTKDYDLIRWDAARFQESSNNQWQLVDTVRSNWFVDDGGQMKTRGQLRFYRASYKNRWKQTNDLSLPQRPMASEEVYALHNVVLSGGPNFVALHGLPYTNTMQGVFGGLENFPGGPTALPDSGSTRVEFYAPGTNALTTEQYWLNSSGHWLQVGGSDVTSTLMGPEFFNRGFAITLPYPLPTNYVTTTALDYNHLDEYGDPIHVPAMVWSPILQVPTNGFSQTIYTGSQSGRVTRAVFNLVALRLPVAVHPGQMRLLESGFVNGLRGISDEIYTLNTTTKDVLDGSTIYCDTNQVWRYMASDNPVPAEYFKPNDIIVIVSKNRVGDGSWTWAYHPSQFYTIPNRWMGN